MRSGGRSKISASEASPISTSSLSESEDTRSALGPGEPAGQYRIFGRILGPPGRDGCIGNQERQVGQFPPALIGPPFRCKAQQYLDDIAEPDIGSGSCYPLARRRRQRDFGQDRRRHGKDRSIGLENGAVATACGDPCARLVDRGDRSAETDRGAVPAAFGFEILDKRAITSRDPPVLDRRPGPSTRRAARGCWRGAGRRRHSPRPSA